MKFVCENCKAKYQIGDDKVSGKTVRMKCRRCGHLILVSATVTESSVARHAAAEGVPLRQPTPAPGALQSAPMTPGSAAPPDEDDEQSTVIMSAPAALRVAPARPGAPGRPAPPAPRPPGVAPPPPAAKSPAPGVAQRPPPPKPSLPGRPLGTPSPGAASPFVPAAAPSAPSVADLAQRSMSSAISAAARGSSNPLGPAAGRGSVARGHLALAPSPAPSHLTPVPSPAQAGNTPSVVPPSGGVAGAFQRAVSAPAPTALRVDTPGEDWYVGVGGVPIGPVRLSVIREKVEQGAVDGESLVWREGFDEWQPLRNVPGLRAILDEPRRATSPPAAEGGPRATISSTSLPRVGTTTNGHSGSSSSTLAALASSPGIAAPTPPPAAPAAPETTGHGALALGNVPTGGVSLGPAASAASAVPPAASPDPAAALPLAPGAASIATKPISIVPPPTTSLAPPSTTERRKGMHPFAYAMIAMAAVFGGVAAWVLFIKPPPAPVVVVQTVTAGPGLNVAPPPPPKNDTPEPTPSASTATEPGKSGPQNPVAGGPRPTSGASAKPGEPPPPNAGSFDNGGVSGPTNGPGTTDNGGGNGKLSEGEIQGVVSRNQARVRRQCWQPALDASSGAGAKSARVSTTITISPSGSVASVNASGAENFPGLASCVAGAIKGWSFPKSDGTTTVNVPFSFNAQ